MKTKNCCKAAALCLPCLLMAVAGCRPEPETRPAGPVKVKVMKAEPAARTGERAYSGTVEESAGTTLSFPVGGTVSRVCVEVGKRVAAGELIAVLDETSLQSAHDATVAALQQAEDAWQRMKQLHDAGSLPEIQWTEAQSKLRQAQSAERISRKNLADSKLCAPFSGVISEKIVETGQGVMPGSPVARLVRVGQVKACISVPESEVSHVGIGQAVSVHVPALDGKRFVGKVVEKGIAANPLSRSYEVKALIDNPAGELMPGMLCTLSLAAGNPGAGEAIVLPARIIQTDEKNRPFVWVNNRGKARQCFLTTGNLRADGVEVTSGLVAGDEVIVEGQQKVSEGTPVSTTYNNKKK